MHRPSLKRSKKWTLIAIAWHPTYPIRLARCLLGHDQHATKWRRCASRFHGQSPLYLGFSQYFWVSDSPNCSFYHKNIFQIVNSGYVAETTHNAVAQEHNQLVSGNVDWKKHVPNRRCRSHNAEESRLTSAVAWAEKLPSQICIFAYTVVAGNVHLRGPWKAATTGNLFEILKFCCYVCPNCMMGDSTLCTLSSKKSTEVDR